MTAPQHTQMPPGAGLELLSVEAMYQADAGAVAAGVPGVTLMENAGAAVAEAIRARWQPCPTMVCCGPGNNGGDGFVIACHLQAAGWPISLALLGSRERLKGDAAHHAKLWGGPVEDLESASLDGQELLVDALFGAGLSRPLEGAARRLIAAALERKIPLVAVDMPSGISGDNGLCLGEVSALADLTVTFFRKKPGHLLLPGRDRCGEVLVADIGIPDEVLATLAIDCWENGLALWQAAVPRRGLADHKYRFGHALILGGRRMTGAARLASRAALRVGAGLVTLACSPETFPIYALGSPSVITLPLDGETSFEDLLQDQRRNAVLVGPGGGVTDETRAAVLAGLASGKATVIDADGLSIFQDDRQALFNALHDNCVLTPHDGEFRRLFPDLDQDNKLERTKAAAARCGATVLLKGADSVIASPDGRATINANAPPELATAGSGDVLAGLIVGLLAQSVPAFAAAAAGAWLQGAAASKVGPGLIAEDLPEALPVVLRELK